MRCQGYASSSCANKTAGSFASERLSFLLCVKGFSGSEQPCPRSTWETGRFYSPSCLEKPSEKGYEQRSERGFGRYEEDEGAEKSLLGGPSGYAIDASEAFRTVSDSGLR